MASSDLLAATSMLPHVLYAGTLGTSSGDIIAPAANHAAVVKSVAACNTTGSPVTVTLTVTKSGGSAVTIVSAFSLVAGDSTSFADVLAGAMFGPGDKLSALAGSGGAINLVVSGTDNS